MHRRAFIAGGVAAVVTFFLGLGFRRFWGGSFPGEADLDKGAQLHNQSNQHCRQEGGCMQAVVVYESLYGNTSTVARAIAEGTLCTGELERARQWGAELAKMLA